MNAEILEVFLLNLAERFNDPEQKAFVTKRIREIIEALRQSESIKTTTGVAGVSVRAGSVVEKSAQIEALPEWPDSMFKAVDQDWKSFSEKHAPEDSMEWANLTMHRIDKAVNRVPVDKRSDLFPLLVKYLLEGNAEQPSLLRWIDE